jgi:hypothetical protein
MSDDAFLTVLRNRDLARLGDSYVNFVFSLAITKASGSPQGVKVSDRLLAEAAKKVGIRDRLPKRSTRADSANAVEALLAHAYLSGQLSLEESVRTLSGNIAEPVTAISQLAQLALELVRRSQ